MLLVYENKTDGIAVEWKKTVHFPPHLHEAIEVVYVTDGNIELGVGQELYHMDEGDFAIVFPNVIHHYQVFGEKENTMDSITNICLDCGFESQRTFNRVFKDRYKITPREHRK